MKYDYLETIKEDIKEAIPNYYETEEIEEMTTEELYEKLYDELWMDDSVTGNASGSYTFNTWKAEENISHNMDLLKEACEEFCCDIPDGAEACDATIRCYLLGQVLTEVIEEIKEEIEEA